MRIDEIELVKKAYKSDKIGNQIEVLEKTTVFCEVKSISRTEFYQAAQSGMKPGAAFIIYLFEYDNQDTVIYNDVEYKVIKTYKINENDIELTCERVIG
ncbi:MAG: phage head closure protein [Intestinibacter bartlettii]|uniref:phage head closure protein n=1 Tax=Intestinibacter bartlettii TaxID=261299 RepID=UPI003996ACE9